MPAESLTVIIPARNATARLGSMLRDWSDQLGRMKLQHSIVVVDDGSANDMAETLARSTVIRCRHESPRGVGACLRTGLEHATGEIVAILLPDYPYAAADLPSLLARFDQEVDAFGVTRRVDAVNGCRTGRHVPAAWRFLGRIYRVGLRIALGVTVEPLAGWLGWRNHVRSWWLWAIFGVPLVDPASGLKLFRRSLLKRIPIQCDGDFALVELFAKFTFLGSVIAEERLAPRTDAVPVASLDGWGTVLRDARFHLPPAAVLEEPAAAAAE